MLMRQRQTLPIRRHAALSLAAPLVFARRLVDVHFS
jgi:hypothetical protein